MNSDIVYKFFRKFKNDHFGLAYMGEFDDELTEGLMRSNETSIHEPKNFKKRLSYLIAECFQNIIRHEDKPDILTRTNDRPKIFLLRNVGNSHYISASNLISNTKKEDLEKICDNARRLAPILIGRVAPNITVADRNNQPHALWDVDADYTVLFFWATDCGHCKKAAPHMVEFAKKFKDRGVKVFAVCTGVVTSKEDSNTPEKVHDNCWKGLEEKEFSDDLFFNVYDPYIRSKYKTLYDVQTTPQIFILNRNHEILMKRIGAEQLGEVMEQVMKFQEEKRRENRN